MSEDGKKLLAYKIAQHCSNPSCGRIASYAFRGEYHCETHFQDIKIKLGAKNIEVIFPTYQEPQFGYTKSNMLVGVGLGGSSASRKWGYRLSPTRRRTSGSKRGTRRSRKDLPDMPVL